MRGITKRFPGVIANQNIDLDVKAGEIHALLGENGAGKSTLMNILYGLARPDEGEILLEGEPVLIADPADAIARGIGMVHQHFMLVPVLTVAENIMLGTETMANPIFIDRREARRRIIELGKRFGFEVDPDAKVETLSVGWQQLVEILKALYRQAKILVLMSQPPCDSAGNGGNLRGSPKAGGRGPQHHLHQPQALRSPGNRRPGHRHPPRPGRWVTPAFADQRG
jgi:simple sugar transport system ATP-binding protein